MSMNYFAFHSSVTTNQRDVRRQMRNFLVVTHGDCVPGSSKSVLGSRVMS